LRWSRGFLRATSRDDDSRHRGDAACMRHRATSTASNGTIVTSWLVNEGIFGLGKERSCSN
jgi:hypothetical protein